MKRAGLRPCTQGLYKSLREGAECRRARDARPYNVAENCNCEMRLQRWVASLQRLDAFTTVGCTAVHRRGAHCAPVYLRCYNILLSERAKGHRGDRKAPYIQSTARPEALTGESPRPPSSREGDRRSGGRSKQTVEGVHPFTFPGCLRLSMYSAVRWFTD